MWLPQSRRRLSGAGRSDVTVQVAHNKWLALLHMARQRYRGGQNLDTVPLKERRNPQIYTNGNKSHFWGVVCRKQYKDAAFRVFWRKCVPRTVKKTKKTCIRATGKKQSLAGVLKPRSRVRVLWTQGPAIAFSGPWWRWLKVGQGEAAQFSDVPERAKGA